MSETASHNLDPLGILQLAPDQAEAQAPNDEERRLVADIRSRYDDARAAKAERERLWEYYRLMQKGESLIARTKVSNEVLRVVLEGDSRRSRSKDNMLLELTRAFVGKLIRVIPSIKTAPRTTDREDMIAAEIRDSFLDYIWNAQRMKLKFKRAVECLPWAGIGIWHLDWDPMGGQDVGLCPECDFASTEMIDGECPVCSADEGDPFVLPPEPVKLVAGKEGHPVVRTVSPYDFFPDPGCGMDMEEAQYVIVARALPVNLLRRTYPAHMDKIKSEDDLYTEKYIGGSGSLGSSRVQTRRLENHAREYTIYENPTGEYPEGRIVTMVNDRIVQKIDQNIFSKLLGRCGGFYIARGDTVHGELWGEEIIAQAESLQRERDGALTQMRRIREMTANPKPMIFKGSGLDNRPWDATPGETISVKSPTLAPRYLRHPDFPQWAASEPDRLKLAAQSKFGVTPHEMGQTTSGDSGRFAAFLESQANETIAAMLLEIHEEWKELHRGIIQVGKHFMSGERVWIITGDDKPRTYSWARANDRPGWDVYLAEEDSLSKNPAMRLQQAQGLLQAGYFIDPSTGQPDWKAFRRMAHLNTATVTADTETSERIRAAQLPEKIREAILNQQPPPMPRPYHNVYIVVEELYNWLQTRAENEEPWLVEAVEQQWMMYAMAAMPDPGQMGDPAIAKFMPNQKLGGQQQMQPQQPGMPQSNMGAGTMPGEDQSMGQLIQGADQMAEAQARSAMPHEGTTV
jgi:hypothetical protein